MLDHWLYIGLFLLVALLLPGAAILLASLALQGLVTPWVLLMLTAATGLGMVLHGPTWQASIPELVPRHSLASAIALGSRPSS